MRETPPAIEAINVEKAFGATRAVAGAVLRVDAGELVALLGPSGSGKTTLLRIIAGFESPDAGTVEIAGRLVAGEGAWEEPDRRRIGMVFQDGALFPHLTVAANVAFGEPREARTRECMDLVGLSDRAGDYPHELSGGERQRVALARALAPEPEVVLLDEPFASLDAGLRLALREEVAQILRAAGASALLVTHDQEEALSLADKLSVIRDGVVAQAGTPEDVYARPASRWVAEFLGDADVVPGTADRGVVECELGRFPTDRALGGAVEVVVRPESLALDSAPSGDGGADALVVGRSFYGHDQLVRLELPSGLRLRSRSLGFPTWHPGDRVRIRVEGPISVLPRAPSDRLPTAPIGTIDISDRGERK